MVISIRCWVLLIEVFRTDKYPLCGRPPPTCLVPGAGLGRLACEISRLGTYFHLILFLQLFCIHNISGLESYINSWPQYMNVCASRFCNKNLYNFSFYVQVLSHKGMSFHTTCSCVPASYWTSESNNLVSPWSSDADLDVLYCSG